MTIQSKIISEFNAITSIPDEAVFLLEYDGSYRKLSGAQLKAILATGGGGINWGSIGGDIENQQDLFTLIKYDTQLGSLPMPAKVGGIPAGTLASALAGKTITQMFDDLLFETVVSIISASKSATLNHNGPSGNVEIGTPLSFTLTAGFNRGTILHGNKVDTTQLVGAATGYTFTGTGISSTNQSGNTLAISINAVEGDNDWNVVVAHAGGSGAYYNNKGVAESHLDGSRASGTASDTNASPNITGVAARFYGPVNTRPTNSAEVRALGVELDTTSTFTLNTGSVETKFFVAIRGKAISSVIDQDALNANITANYINLGTLSVNDAGGNPQTYTIYEMSIAGPYSSNHRHLITTV